MWIRPNNRIMIEWRSEDENIDDGQTTLIGSVGQQETLR